MCLRRKVLFSILKNVPNYISERNGSAEVEVNNSNGTFVCDGDAHKVVLCPRMYEVGLTEVKETD